MLKISPQLSLRLANTSLFFALAVVFIHCPHPPEDIGSCAWAIWFWGRKVIGHAAVPFFFVVSGFLLAKNCENNGWWKQAVIKRIRTLLVPYLICCGIASMVIYFGLSATDRVTPYRVLCWSGCILFDHPAHGVFWYLRALMMFVLISPLINYFVRRCGIWWLALLFVAHQLLAPGDIDGCSYWLSGKWRYFWWFGVSLQGLFYFSVGCLSAIRPVPLSRRLLILMGMIGVGLGVLCFVVAAGRGELGVFEFMHPHLMALNIPFTLAGIWGLLPIWNIDRKWTALPFPIYVLHPFVFQVLNKTGFMGGGIPN